MVTEIHTGTYNFAIEVVFLDHHSVDTFRVPEGEETKSSRATRGGVTHDGALADLAKLCEVALERV